MAKDNQDRKQKAIIHISFTSLVSFLFLGVAAIALAYIGGVMSGRQSCPVQERLLSVEAPQPGQSLQPDESRRILNASELDFARELRGENNRVARIVPSTEEKKGVATPGKEAEKPAEKDVPAQEKLKPQQAIKPENSMVKAPDSESIYDHVFQVGAFRDENSVDKLRQKLEGHGLRTTMRKEGKVYVVLVRLRGTSARAAEVVGLAHSLGLGEPVQRSRQPVRD